MEDEKQLIQQQQTGDANKKKELCIPIIYGNISIPLIKKANDDSIFTNEWLLYVRGLHFEDLSFLIKRVIITLHPSFEDPIHYLESHPFEMSQPGWGEFEIQISIQFNDESLKPLDIIHLLKLHHYNIDKKNFNPKDPVVSETYDEIIILNSPVQILFINNYNFFNKIQEQLEKQYQEAVQKVLEIKRTNGFQIYEKDKEMTMFKYINFMMSAEEVENRKKNEKQILLDATAFINQEISSLQKKVQSLNDTLTNLHKEYDEKKNS